MPQAFSLYGIANFSGAEGEPPLAADAAHRIRCYNKSVVLVGIDEVGRGSWAGPVVAGAVVLPPHFHTKRGDLILRDSKLLTKEHRIIWDKFIRRRALAIGLGWVWPDEIDRIGLTLAVQKSMQQALAEIRCIYDEIIIDGNHNYLAEAPNCRTLIGADNIIPSVSAAAVVAKVARDNWMATHAHTSFPAYGFDRHVGYGTPSHRAAIKTHGICELHRRSWEPIRQYLAVQELPLEIAV